jgi:hypothetical protein
MGVGVSDTFLAGHLTPAASASLGYGQATAVAAVGVATIATWVSITTFFAINIGVTALVARATGAEDSGLARRSATHGDTLRFITRLEMANRADQLADRVTAEIGVTGQVAGLVEQYIRVFVRASLRRGSLGGDGGVCGPRRAPSPRRDADRQRRQHLASWTPLNGVPAGVPAFGVVGRRLARRSAGAYAGLAFTFRCARILKPRRSSYPICDHGWRRRGASCVWDCPRRRNCSSSRSV